MRCSSMASRGRSIPPPHSNADLLVQPRTPPTTDQRLQAAVGNEAAKHCCHLLLTSRSFTL